MSPCNVLPIVAVSAGDTGRLDGKLLGSDKGAESGGLTDMAVGSGRNRPGHTGRRPAGKAVRCVTP